MGTVKRHYDYELIIFTIFVLIFIIQMVSVVFIDNRFIPSVLIASTFVLYGMYYLIGTFCYWRHLYIKFTKDEFGQKAAIRRLDDTDMMRMRNMNIKIGVTYILLGIIIMVCYYLFLK